MTAGDALCRLPCATTFGHDSGPFEGYTQLSLRQWFFSSAVCLTRQWQCKGCMMETQAACFLRGHRSYLTWA